MVSHCFNRVAFRRERGQDVDLEAVKKVVPKSDSTRQRLGNILR